MTVNSRSVLLNNAAVGRTDSDGIYVMLGGSRLPPGCFALSKNPARRTSWFYCDGPPFVAGFFMRGRMGGMGTDDNDLDDDDESTGILDLLTREPTTDRRSLLVGLLITALGALIFVARLIHSVTR